MSQVEKQFINGEVLKDENKLTSVSEHESSNLEFQEQAAKFIAETSLDKMLEMAEAAIQRRRLERAAEPPKWVIPDDF